MSPETICDFRKFDVDLHGPRGGGCSNPQTKNKCWVCTFPMRVHFLGSMTQKWESSFRYLLPGQIWQETNRLRFFSISVFDFLNEKALRPEHATPYILNT